MINEKCSICGNVSGYDEESLAGSSWIINGVNVVLCCPCEDDLLKQLIERRIPRDRFIEIAESLMSDERDDLLDLITRGE